MFKLLMPLAFSVGLQQAKIVNTPVAAVAAKAAVVTTTNQFHAKNAKATLAACL
jgi:pyrroloquinoline quinone (PQQ) biosynthesis protein C